MGSASRVAIRASSAERRESGRSRVMAKGHADGAPNVHQPNEIVGLVLARLGVLERVPEAREVVDQDEQLGVGLLRLPGEAFVDDVSEGLRTHCTRGHSC